MKLEAIPNRGPASMGPEIDRSLRWAIKAEIATAFITPAAARNLEHVLSLSKSAKRRLRIRLIFGLYQRFTSPDAVRFLLRLQRKYPGALFIKVARNERFHWKYYCFRKGSARRFYVGSANFTQDGLSAEGELTLKATASTHDAITKSLQEEFERVWQNEDESLPLNATFIKLYDRVSRPPAFITRPEEDDPVRRILRKPERRKRKPTRAANPRIVFIDEYLSDETAEVVEVETSWHRKRWFYICRRQKSQFELDRDAHINLLADFLDGPGRRWIEFARVVDTAELDTPDGKYFIAYERIPGGWKRNFDRIKQDLKDVGLTLRRLESGGKLNRAQLERLSRMLHVNLE